jgi:nucleoside-diphosphate-sugar epimerase
MAVKTSNIFITGASGFVGGAAARRLAAGGDRVRAMSRSSPSDQKIRAIGAEPVRCDLDTVIAADIRGAEVVIHCAAFVARGLRTPGIASTSRAPGVCSALPNRPAPDASFTSGRKRPWSSANICGVR